MSIEYTIEGTFLAISILKQPTPANILTTFSLGNTLLAIRERS